MNTKKLTDEIVKTTREHFYRAEYILKEEIEKTIENHLAPIRFPEPPPGRKWHNPSELTVAQLGDQKLWRLCLIGEPCLHAHQGWSETARDWIPCIWVNSIYQTKFIDDDHRMTYRTRKPLPRKWDNIREAIKEGKPVQWRGTGIGTIFPNWVDFSKIRDCFPDEDNHPTVEWRLKPRAKRAVSLSMESIPMGSLLRRDMTQESILKVIDTWPESKRGVRVECFGLTSGIRLYKLATQLRDEGWEILRPASVSWEPCWYEVEE